MIWFFASRTNFVGGCFQFREDIKTDPDLSVALSLAVVVAPAFNPESYVVLELNLAFCHLVLQISIPLLFGDAHFATSEGNIFKDPLKI